MEKGVRARRPPADATFGKPACDEPEAEPVIAQQLESCAAAITKDEESAGERIFSELPLAKSGQPVDAVTEIDGLAGEQDPQLWYELNHREALLRKSEQMALMMSVLDGGTVIRIFEPS